VFESGTPDAQGRLAGDADYAAAECVKRDHLDEQSRCFSPHYDVITRPDQAAVYESVMGDTLGRITYVLLYGDTYLKDNRIPPIGFRATDARYDPATAIEGLAVNDPDFNVGRGGEGSGSDVVHYRLDWTDKPESGLKIEAVLYYQALRPAVVAGLQHDGPKLGAFRAMYAALKPRALLLDRTAGQYP
jgi:hypothetical protein